MTPKEAAQFWEENAETWTRHARAGYDVYRDALNTPWFMGILPPVDGLAGLDIGCGEGYNTRELARRGARMTGVDIAPTFIRHARQAEEREPRQIRYVEGSGMALPFPDGSFDFATAFMSLMDMPHPCEALREAGRVLRPGGFLQFSILHPCFAPPQRRVMRDADGKTAGVKLGQYFARGSGELDIWWFSSAPPEERAAVAPFKTPRFHRTLSDWVAMMTQAGFAIEMFSEPQATEELAAAVPLVEDTRSVPLFLQVRLRKP